MENNKNQNENQTDKRKKNLLIAVASLLLLLMLSIITYIVITNNQKVIEKNDDMITVKEEQIEVPKPKPKDEPKVVVDENFKKSYTLDYTNGVNFNQNIIGVSQGKTVSAKDIIKNDGFKFESKIVTNEEIKKVSVKVYDITSGTNEQKRVIQDENFNIIGVDYDLTKDSDATNLNFLINKEIKSKVFRDEIELELLSKTENNYVYGKTYNNIFKYYVTKGYQAIGFQENGKIIFLGGDTFVMGQVYELYVNDKLVEINNNDLLTYTKTQLSNSFTHLLNAKEVVNDNSDVQQHGFTNTLVGY